MCPVLQYRGLVWDLHHEGQQEELKKVQKRAVRFVKKNFNYVTGLMTDILEELKWETGGRIIYSYFLTHFRIMQNVGFLMTLFNL